MQSNQHPHIDSGSASVPHHISERSVELEELSVKAIPLLSFMSVNT